MKKKNPAMRDFPLARINLTKHVRQGNKYRVWPLMNLAVTVDDIDLEMTHVIRAKDHRDNAERQKKMYEALGIGTKFPWTGFLGRIHLKDMELSSTDMKRGYMDKRGLDAVVTTLLIILLVLVAVGIIWVVVRNVVQQGSEQIDINARCLSVDLQAV